MAQRNPNLAVAFSLFIVFIMPQIAAASWRDAFPKIVKGFLNKQGEEVIKGMPDRLDYLIQHGYLFGDKTSKVPSRIRNNRTKEERSIGGQGDDAAAIDAGSYIISFDVGTPPQRLSGMLDINSEILWTQCNRTTTAQQQPAGGGTIFYTKNSSTVDFEPCTSSACNKFPTPMCSANRTYCVFTDSYIGNNTGYLASEKFRFGGDSDDPVTITFGCGPSDDDMFGRTSGVIGLGRGPFSLVTQLGNGRFSYYFAPDSDDTTESFVYFGEAATPKSSGSVQSTPLLASSSNAFSNFYYVGLTGIRVDGQDLPIPAKTFDLKKNGSGGVILSIITPITFLDERAYKVLKQTLRSKIGLPTADGSPLGLDLCYTNKSLTAAEIPAMALVFEGNAIMDLETWNYFYMDADTGLYCLTILESPKGGASLLGNLIQEGTHLIYDVRGETLQFESFQKKAAPPSRPPKLSNRSPLLAQSMRMCFSAVSIMLYWIIVTTL